MILHARRATPSALLVSHDRVIDSPLASAVVQSSAVGALLAISILNTCHTSTYSEPTLLDFDFATSASLGDFLESSLGSTTGRAAIVVRQISPSFWSLCEDIPAILKE